MPANMKSVTNCIDRPSPWPRTRGAREPSLSCFTFNSLTKLPIVLVRFYLLVRNERAIFAMSIFSLNLLHLPKLMLVTKWELMLSLGKPRVVGFGKEEERVEELPLA